MFIKAFLAFTWSGVNCSLQFMILFFYLGLFQVVPGIGPAEGGFDNDPEEEIFDDPSSDG